eukprot:tig00000459_g1139.t1
MGGGYEPAQTGGGRSEPTEFDDEPAPEPEWREVGDGLVQTVVPVSMPRYVLEGFARLPLEGRWDMQRLMDDEFHRSAQRAAALCGPNTPLSTLRILIAQQAQDDFYATILPALDTFLIERGLF